jgi:hypothetical protein
VVTLLKHQRKNSKMSLEEVLTEIGKFVVNMPSVAITDIGGHLLTGAFLVQRYFPEVPKSQRLAFGFLAGLAPDFDYFTFGLIQHRTLTHTVAFGAGITLNAYAANSETLHKPVQSFYQDVLHFFQSRYTKLAAFGMSLHLALDQLDGNPDRALYGAMYCAMMGTALILQNEYNRRGHRSEIKAKQRIKPCVVIAETEIYWVTENVANRIKPGDDLQEYKDLPILAIPDYQYGEWEKVREVQTQLIPYKNVFQRIDDYLSQAWNKLKGTTKL